MADFPDKCPSCNEPNRNNLNFCAVCGRRFQRKVHTPSPAGSRNKTLSKEQKLKVKKLKKKKELVDLYKRKKITTEQFTKGMTKLGYSTDIEKATEFKKYIREQIKAFEKLDVSGVQEGEYHFDPNESKAQLPRDEFGNVITDFSVKPTPSASNHIHHETYAEPKMVTSRPPSEATSSGSPLFGESLFANSGPSRQKTPRKEIPKAKLKRDIPVGRRTHHKIRGRDLDWDEEEEELIEEEMTEEEEEFVIDLDEEDFEGEKGWWDDEEWELDWDDEDEEEELEIDLDEEDEWETWEGGEEDDDDHDDEWLDEDEEIEGAHVIDDEEEEFDLDEEEIIEGEDEEIEGAHIIEEEELIEEEDDEEEDDWDEPRRRRRR